MLFPVDHGNSSIKTVNFVFSSGLADYPIRPPVDTDILEYGGKYWTLSGKRISYMRDKTKDDRYFSHVCSSSIDLNSFFRDDNPHYLFQALFIEPGIQSSLGLLT